MKTKPRETMLLKLIAGCLTPLLAAVLAQSLFTISTERRSLMEGLSAKAQAVGRLMVDVVGPSIAFDDAQAVGDGLGYVAGDADFAYALAVKADGTHMGYRGDPALERERFGRFSMPSGPREVQVAGVTEVALPVRSNGQSVGAVVVGFNSDRVHQEVNRMVLSTSAISLAGIGAAVLVVLLLARTIAQKNRDMRLVLDSVDQAIFTVRPDGVMLDERSAIGARVFQGSPHLWNAIGAVDPKAGAWVRLGWESIVEDVLPLDVAIDQLPRKVSNDERTWSVEYKPLREGHVITKWLVVMSDVTNELERQRAEAEGSDLLRLLEMLARDRRGVVTFIAEADRLVAQIAASTSNTARALDLHTLKGISALNGLECFARLIHQIEDRVAECQFDETDVARLKGAWASFHRRLVFMTGGAAKSIEVPRADFEDLLARLEAVPGTDAVRAQVRALTQEPIRLPLERAAAQARALGVRLGREGLTVVVEPTGLRVPESFADFWANWVHVVRNAVDHGIESAAERVAAGKPSGGTIVMRAVERAGGGFAIEIQDDGRGINFAALAQIAERASLAMQTKQDLIRALFVDGVSTRQSVTEISGRGVGLAAVLRAVEALGGDIDVESEPGKGTLFRFRFPGQQGASRAA